MSASMIPWVGGKSSLLWIIDLLAPGHYDCFVDVFGGSGTVTLSRSPRPGCVEVYNDVNRDLVNLFRCARDCPLALVKELNFLPLHSREEFDNLCRFLEQEEFENEYAEEELQIAQEFFSPEESEILCAILDGRAELGDVRRAAAFFRKQRESYNSGGRVFGAKPVNITRFFHLIWSCSRRLRNVVLECRDFAQLIGQYDGPNTFIYSDPPYFMAEQFYDALFTREDHIRLHRVHSQCKGYVMVSYNCCDFIRDLYQDFFIFQTKRPNSMSHEEGAEYEEYILTNYDPNVYAAQTSLFGLVPPQGKQFQLVHAPEIVLKTG